jgi:hypothetical protein
MTLYTVRHKQGGKPTITDRYGSNNVLPKPDTVLGGHNDVAILSENTTTVDGARVSVPHAIKQHATLSTRREHSSCLLLLLQRNTSSC